MGLVDSELFERCVRKLAYEEVFKTFTRESLTDFAELFILPSRKVRSVVYRLSKNFSWKSVSFKLDYDKITIVVNAEKVKRSRLRLNLLSDDGDVVAKDFGIALDPSFKILSFLAIILRQGRIDYRELA